MPEPAQVGASDDASKESVTHTSLLETFRTWISPTSKWKWVRNILKVKVASTIISFLIVFDTSKSWFGSAPYLAHVALVYLLPIGTIGAMLEAVVSNLLIYAVAVAVNILARFTATLTFGSSNRSRDIQLPASFLLAGWLGLMMWNVGYFRTLFPRINNGLMLSAILSIISLGDPEFTPSTASQFALKVFDVSKPILLGAIISLSVNLLFFPDFGARHLRTLAYTTLLDVREYLTLLVHAFLLESDADGMSDAEIKAVGNRVRGSVEKLRRLMWEAGLEIGWSRYLPGEYGQLVDGLEEVVGRLNAMRSVIKNIRRWRDEEREQTEGDARDSDPTIADGEDPPPVSITVKASSSSVVENPPSPQMIEAVLSSILEGHHVDVESTLSYDPAYPAPTAHDHHILLKNYITSLAQHHHDLANATLKCLGDILCSIESVPGRLIESEVQARTPIFGNMPKPPLHRSASPGEHAYQREEQAETSVARLRSSINMFNSAQVHHVVGIVGSGDGAVWTEEVGVACFFGAAFRDAAKAVAGVAEGWVELEKRHAGRVDGKDGRFKSGNRWWFPWGALWETFKVSSGSGSDVKAVLYGNPHATGKKARIPDTKRRKLRFLIWSFTVWMSGRHARFGVKLALATLALTWPAYVYPEWYFKFKAYWAAITLMVVMAPTVGGSIQVGIYRIGGTVLASLGAVAAWWICRGNPYVLVLMVEIFGLPFWYIYFQSGHARIGTTAIVGMYVITFMTYLEVRDSSSPTPVQELVLLRAATIVFGAIIGIVLDRSWWPLIARIQIRIDVAKSMSALALLYSLNAAILWRQVEKRDRREVVVEEGVEWTGVMRRRLSRGEKRKEVDVDEKEAREEIEEAVMVERSIRDAITSHKVLLALVKLEPQLRSPFPDQLYGEMLECMQGLLDKMMTVRHVLTADGGFSEAHVDVIEKMQEYRKDILAAVLLTFHVLEGSLISKEPLPVYMPAVKALRARAVLKMMAFKLPVEVRGDEVKNYINYFAVKLTQHDIANDLLRLTECVRSLRGQVTFPFSKRPTK